MILPDDLINLIYGAVKSQSFFVYQFPDPSNSFNLPGSPDTRSKEPFLGGCRCGEQSFGLSVTVCREIRQERATYHYKMKPTLHRGGQIKVQTTQHSVVWNANANADADAIAPPLISEHCTVQQVPAFQ